MSRSKNITKTSFKSFTSIRPGLLVAFLVGSLICILILSGFSPSHFSEIAGNDHEKKWVGTWTTAPQLVEPRNMPPEPRLNNNTLRQIVRISIGGDSLRIRFSNEFSSNPTSIQSVEIATSLKGDTIDVSTIKELKFNGRSQVKINPQEAVTSDPVAFPLKPRHDLAITIHFGTTPQDLTGHPGSRTTSYILEGEKTSAANFSGGTKTDHWYIISGIDVKAPEFAAAVAILGNSITDGRGSGTNKQNRWPDILAERLLENSNTQQIGVLNQGIGGNCVLKPCLGPSGIERFDRDILNQHGVKWVIIMEGVNDLGGAKDSTEAFQVAKGLIAAYDQMIEKAHARDLKIYGGTITPIKESFYYSEDREAARNFVNEWIRSSRFDAVIDFDKALRNPKDTLTILPEAHTGDYLHPNEMGYRIMGKTVDLSLFK